MTTMPQIDPTWFASQIFWLVASFALLYVLLTRVVLPPLTGTIHRRSDAISSDLSVAEAAKNDAERIRKDYDQTISQSREMAQGLISEVLDENKQHADKTLRSLEAEIAKKLEDAANRINNRKMELLNSLTPAAAEFAAMIAEKITQKPVNPDQASRVVMDMIKVKDAA